VTVPENTRTAVNRSRIQHGARRHVERHPGSRATTVLPDDLVREQSLRIQLFYAIGVIVWSISLVMDIYLAPYGDRGPYQLIAGMAGVMAAGVAWYARFSPRSHQMKINLGVACLVPQALAIALLNSWVEQPTTMRPLSGITGLLLVFGMLAPAKPGKLLTAAAVAALMDPLGVWIAHLRGLPVPSVLGTLLMFHPNYVAAILTVAPAQILYRLGRQLSEARALGSYQLIELLGQGGMGEVWLAHHRLLVRSAAIKLVRPDMLGAWAGASATAATTLGRFEREAQATAALTSPHTIRLYDFGLTDEGSFYYAMELLDGRDLESLVRDFGPLSPARTMYLVRQVCRSLAEAHAIGLIHRDIKPANIYVCRMGVEYDFIKVLDFGLVTSGDRRGASALVTAEHVAIGTPAYMAPEAILGGATIDHRADLYALGCVAYFLLTGERVFQAESQMKLLMQHVNDAPIPPSRRTEQPIPREIDDIVLACLHKDPNRRPHSAEELGRLASGQIANAWDQQAAQRWWAAHLPQLMTPETVTIPGWDRDARVLATG
jgi:eukaryotic-like serine/threonine-protein kinase